jgi:hypothetical protein
MYKGTNEITNKDLDFKLTNYTSFGESVISVGFNQKTVKTDLHVRVNYAIPPRNQHENVPEDSRQLHTEVGLDPLTCGADRPHLEAAQPLWGPPLILVVMLVSQRLLGCISAIS